MLIKPKQRAKITNFFKKCKHRKLAETQRQLWMQATKNPENTRYKIASNSCTTTVTITQHTLSVVQTTHHWSAIIGTKYKVMLTMKQKIETTFQTTTLYLHLLHVLRTTAAPVGLVKEKQKIQINIIKTLTKALRMG